MLRGLLYSSSPPTYLHWRVTRVHLHCQAVRADPGTPASTVNPCVAGWLHRWRTQSGHESDSFDTWALIVPNTLAYNVMILEMWVALDINFTCAWRCARNFLGFVLAVEFIINVHTFKTIVLQNATNNNNACANLHVSHTRGSVICSNNHQSHSVTFRVLGNWIVSREFEWAGLIRVIF